MSDINLSSLDSNYLTGLAPKQTHAIIEGDKSAASLMSVDEEAAVRAITSALSASSPTTSPDFFTPWCEDDLLTTTASDADMGMTPDIFTSPVLTDLSTLGPARLPPLPLPDMDDLYKMSPGASALDTPSLFPVDFERPSTLKAVLIGTRKNVTPESLVPYDAPIQPRKYRTRSVTSRKELPVTFARKRARTQGPEEEEEVPGPSVSKEDEIKLKRLRNTLAARRSRKRKLDYQRKLKEAIEAER